MTQAGEKRTYAIDPMHSSARFSIRHLMIAHAHGAFTQVTGTVETIPDAPSQLHVNATIAADSFQTGNAQRDEHVKSAQFLDVAAFPTLTFLSSPTPNAPNNTEVIGNLTMHGVTREVTLLINEISSEITDPWGSLRVGVTATTQIKRSDFGITFNAPIEGGGVMLSDVVDVTLDLELTRKPE